MSRSRQRPAISQSKTKPATPGGVPAMGAARPRIVRRPRLDKAQLHRDLAKRFNEFPPETWSVPMLVAMIGLLDGYALSRDASLHLPDTSPIPIRLIP